MAEIRNTTSILKGRVVTLDQIRADNALVDSCRLAAYGLHYKYERETLPDFIDVKRFNNGECNNEKEVAILQNAVKCLKAMYICLEDTSILDEYANDTLLEFDYATGKNIFDEETFQKDSDEYKNKQRALIAEYNKIVASSTLLNAIENAKKLQQIKDKIDELRKTQPTKDDAKYNHPEIVKGSTSVKQALDRYKELRERRDKYGQEWKQYMLDYKLSRAKKLSISEDTFRVFKELYKEDVFTSGTLNVLTKLFDAAISYESVKDYNENNWKNARFDTRDECRKFLNQKQFKLWQKYGKYIEQHSEPNVPDWMMYDHFNDTDLMWLNALKAFDERVRALKYIEEQHTDACEQHTNACEQHTDACEQHTDACEKNSSK